MDEKEKEEIVKRLANLEQDKANLVSEIKELRAKKDPSIDATLVEDKAKEIVNKILSEESGKKSANERVVAEEEFKQKFKEFHPDNDPSGIKYTAFQKSLQRINLSGLKTSDEYKEAFEDAYLVMNKQSIKNGSYSNQSDFNPEMGGNIRSVDADNLSPKEMKLIKQQGMDKAQYIKMRDKRPAYVRELLNWIN